MGDDFELVIKGAEDFAAAARDVRAAGKDVQKQLYAALERCARPLQDLVRTEGTERLPQSGGRDVRVTRLKRTGTVEIDGQEYVRRARVKTTRARANQSLAQRVRQARYTLRMRGGRDPGVKLIATDRTGQRIDLNALDRGTVRHPVFGNRRAWVDQVVEPGWWTDTLTGSRALTVVRGNVLLAVDAVIRTIRAGRGNG